MTRSIPFLRAISDRAMPTVRWIGPTVAVGGLLAVLGPFGSYMNGGPGRLFCYWIGATLLGLLLYGSAYRIVSTATRPRSGQWLMALIGATLLASVPEALATRVAAFWLWPDLARFNLPLPLWFAQTTAIGLIAMAGVSIVLRSAKYVSEDDPVPSSAVATISAAATVATPLGGDVLALQMEDHYVRVHRLGGSELILMPLARAIESVHAQGLRTHRSWWVASHAVAAVEGNARSMRLLLSNGVVAPVARSAITHLKAAGWIAAAQGSDRSPT
ncbi:LytTR family DNA-binding domain-containing protein [Sphingomonas sp. RB3P16]|uniref:LytTR family DNA-binding domain-containing protein n=1 Tax=Parasphingomonas frigoris TaxID=3096163 RepID=UPI002FCA3478